jgi:mRNA interferase RelE/StbE
VKYRLIIEKKVQKDARSIPVKMRGKIDTAIIELSENPHPRQSLKLTVPEGYRLIVGDYRVLYKIDDSAKIVVINRIKSRNEATNI